MHASQLMQTLQFKNVEAKKNSCKANYLFIWFLNNIFKYNISVSLNKNIGGLCHCLRTFPQTHCPTSLALWLSNTDVDLTDTLSAWQIRL